jgi:hypothetical protein
LIAYWITSEGDSDSALAFVDDTGIIWEQQFRYQSSISHANLRHNYVMDIVNERWDSLYAYLDDLWNEFTDGTAIVLLCIYETEIVE